MIELESSLIIEATGDPEFFDFYSSDLDSFTGVRHSIEDCLYIAKWGIKEYVNLLKEQGLPIPPKIKIQREHQNFMQDSDYS